MNTVERMWEEPLETKHPDLKHLLPSPSAEFMLWRLKNPETMLQGTHLDAVFEHVHSPKDVESDEPPLVFIHGVEYGSPVEVLRDLVRPFLLSLYSKTSINQALQRTIYFVSWNSVLMSSTKRSELLSQSKFSRSLWIVKELPRWHYYCQAVEERAALAGQALIPFIVEWCSHSKIGPTVVSHSLGAKVWADALKTIASESSMLTRPGVWWNLQPALTRSAFTQHGEYALVAKMYHGGSQAKAVTWYSRFDFVLSTLFWITKGKPALGQFGCPDQAIPQRDVTKWVKEAHGVNYLTGSLGSLFQRAADQIAEQARDLGIIA